MATAAPELQIGSPSQGSVVARIEAARPFVVALPRLPEEAQDDLYNIMYGRQAQLHYQKSEGEYVAYVRQCLGRAKMPELRAFAGSSTVRRQSPVAQPSPDNQRVDPPPSPAPAPSTGAIYGQRQPLLRTSLRPTAHLAAPNIAPPPRSTAPAPAPIDLAEFTARRDTYNATSDRYANIVAEQRLSHGATLLANERGHGRLRVLAGRIGAVAIDLRAWQDYRQADMLAHQETAARHDYLAALTAYVTSAKGSSEDQVRLRLAVMDGFEQSVESKMLALADPPQNPPTIRFQRRLQSAHQRLTNAWIEGPRWRRAVSVAIPALGAGAILGAVAGASNAPPEAVLMLWYAATHVGSSIGTGLARIVNRLEVTRDDIRDDMRQQTKVLNSRFAQSFQHQRNLNHADIDVTLAYNARTLDWSVAHWTRLRRAQAVGAATAAAAFGAADAASIAFGWFDSSALPPAAHPSPNAHTVPTQTPHTSPTPNIVPTPAPPQVTNIDAYPWEVAFQLDPSHPMDMIQRAADAYNAQFGTHLHLVPQTNGKVWLEDGQAALNHAQQVDFNQYMVDHFQPGPR